MSTSDNKFNSLCENLEGCKLDDVETKINDEELFKQPPPLYEDCPICFLRIPTLQSGSKYNICCGKTICSGCAYAPVYDNQGNIVVGKKCAFCRVPAPTSEGGIVKRLGKRVEADDPIAIYHLGMYYRDGLHGFKQDCNKALELYHRSGELGHIDAYCNIGYLYKFGLGVEVDEKKAIHYYELAAMKGDVVARSNLGNKELKAGDLDRALKHYVIAVRDGYSKSLDTIKQLYSNGHATKEDYTKALRLYQEYLGEIKSGQRDEAAAFDSEKYRYY